MDERDTFNSWCDQWEKAQKQGVFKDAPTTRVPTPNYEDFFGNYRPPQDSHIEEPDAEYWRQVYDMSRHAGDTPDVADPEEEEEMIGSGEEMEVLQDNTLSPYAPDEDKTQTDTPERPKWSKKSLQDMNDTIAKSPNPIYPYSKGRDQGQGGERKQSTTVTKNWTDGNELVELHTMKINLEKLESKMNTAEGLNDHAKAKKIQKQIGDLWQKIEELSNELNPNFVNDYLS